MSQFIVCQNVACGKRLRVSESMLGKRVRCKACAQTLLVDPELITAERAEQETLIQPASPLETLIDSNAKPMVEPNSPRPETADSSLDVIGTLGRFQLLGRLGAGAFGLVHRAYDPQLDREVALKVPHATIIQNPDRVERFFREARAAAGLRHPNIVPVFDSGEVDGNYFIASAFIIGKPLDELVSRARSDLRQVAEWTRKILEGLDYAHSQGVVHRDIKPSNVLIDDKNEPLIADFGLASRQDDDSKLTSDGTIMGTPSYMAPEQALGQRGEPLPASDQYSVGIMLYEMLCGKPPFDGPAAIVMHNQIHTPPPALKPQFPGLPRDIETICLKALSKRPEDRYSSCSDMADDLRRWLDGEPIAARRLGLYERSIRWAKREPKLTATLGAFMISLAAIGVLLTVRNTRLMSQLQTIVLERDVFRDRAESEAERADKANRLADMGKLAHADARAQLGDSPTVAKLVSSIPKDLRGSEWGYVRMKADRAPDFRRKLTPPDWPPGQTSPTGSFAVLFSEKEKSVLGLTTFLPFSKWRLSDGRAQSLSPIVGLTADVVAHRVSSNRDGTRIAFVVLKGGKREQVWTPMSPAPSFTAPMAPAPMPVPMPAPAPSNAPPSAPPAVPVENPQADRQRQPFETDSPVIQGRFVSMQTPAPVQQPVPQSAQQTAPIANAPEEPVSMSIYVFDTKSMKHVFELELPVCLPSIAISPDGKLLALTYAEPSLTHRLSVWDIDTQAKRVELDKTIAPHPFDGAIVAFSHKSDRLAALTALTTGEISIWDVANGKELNVISEDVGIVTDIVFSPDGTRIAAIGGEELKTNLGTKRIQLASETVHKSETSTYSVCIPTTAIDSIHQIDNEGFECTADVKKCVINTEQRTVMRQVSSSYANIANLPPPTLNPAPRIVQEQITIAETHYQEVCETKLRKESSQGKRVVAGKEEPCNCEVEVPYTITRKVPVTKTRSQTVQKKMRFNDVVRIWEIEDGQLTFRVEEPELVNAIAWRTDGARLAGATIGARAQSDCLDSLGQGCNPVKHALLVRLWDSHSTELMMTLDHDLENAERASCIAISPDGNHVAIGLDNSPEVICWSAESEQLIAVKTQLPYPLTQLVFSHDDRSLGAHSQDHGRSSIFDGKQADLICSMNKPDYSRAIGFGEKDEFITGLNVRPNSMFRAHVQPGIAAWDRSRGVALQQKAIGAVLPTPNGAKLLAASETADLHFVDSHTGEVQTRFENSSSAGNWLATADGSKVARTISADNNLHRLQVWDGKTGKVLFEKQGFSFPLSFYRDRNPGSNAVHLSIIQLKPETALMMVDSAKGNILKYCPIAPDVASQAGEIITLSLSRALVVDRNLSSIALYDLESKREMSRFRLPFNFEASGAFTISPDLTHLAVFTGEQFYPSYSSGSNSCGLTVQQPKIQIVDVASGNAFSINIFASWIQSMEFSKDNTRLAYGGTSISNKTFLEVADVETGKQIASYPSQPGRINCIAFNQSGEIIAAANCDRTLNYWKAPAPGSEAIVVNAPMCSPVPMPSMDNGFPMSVSMQAPPAPMPGVAAPMPADFASTPAPINSPVNPLAHGPTKMASVQLAPPKVLEWNQLVVTTSGNFLESTEPKSVMANSAKNSRPVLTTHPVSRQTPATIEFNELTRNDKGILKIAMRSENDEPILGGGARIVVKSGTNELKEVHVSAKKPVVIDVPFDHQEIVLEHHATGWNDEFNYLQFAVVAPPPPPPPRIEPKTTEPTSKDEDLRDKESKVENKAKEKVGTTALSAMEQQVLKLTNAERAKNGLKPLVASEKLFVAARSHAENMAKKNQLNHTLDGQSASDRVTKAGYNFSRTGENIAYNQVNPIEVVQDWMTSPGHRANILTADYAELGVGVAVNSKKEHYWVQVFGTPAQ